MNGLKFWDDKSVFPSTSKVIFYVTHKASACASEIRCQQGDDVGKWRENRERQQNQKRNYEKNHSVIFEKMK